MHKHRYDIPWKLTTFLKLFLTYPVGASKSLIRLASKKLVPRLELTKVIADRHFARRNLGFQHWLYEFFDEVYCTFELALDSLLASV